MEYEGEIAGYVQLSYTYSNEVGGICCWVEELYIREAFRGKGLGSELLTFLDDTYGDKVKRFRLEVTAENERAANLYRRFGYKPLAYQQKVKDL